MKDRVVLLAGYDGTIAGSIRTLFKRHGATIIDVFNEKNLSLEMLKNNEKIDSLVFISHPNVITSIEKIDSLAANSIFQSGCLFLHSIVKQVLPIMKRQREGNIVSIVPDYAVAAVPGVSICAANAAASVSYLRAVAIECCKFGIRANSVLTGFSIAENGDAQIHQLGKEAAEDAFVRYQPLGRRGSCEDVANAALFCASSMSNSITGESIPVNGGVLIVGHSQVWQPKDKSVFSLTLKEQRK
jgi:enoyl-[acyl-carrier-protein] reductase (NADH)